MSYKFVFLPPAGERARSLGAAIQAAVSGIEIAYGDDRDQALAALPGARAAFGTLDAELLAAASDLEWLASPAAGPPKGYYFPELIASDITVTNIRGIYNDHISTHIMAFVLAFARGMHRYFRDQFEGHWRKGGEGSPSTYLPESTALIVGVGGIAVTAASTRMTPLIVPFASTRLLLPAHRRRRGRARDRRPPRAFDRRLSSSRASP